MVLTPPDVAEDRRARLRLRGARHLAGASTDDGRLWIFEVNSKPMPFVQPLPRARSILRLPSHAGHLAGWR